VDFWDNLPATGQDLELTEISLLTLVGFVLSFRLVWLAVRLTLLSLHESIAALTEVVRDLPSGVRFESALPHDLPNPALSLRV